MGETTFSPYRVVKQGPKLLFVENDRYDPAKRTFTLSRWALEVFGFARQKSTSLEPVFCAKPEPIDPIPTPSCFRELGLVWPASAEEIVAAYQKERARVHPEFDGDSSLSALWDYRSRGHCIRSVEVEQAYWDALTFLRRSSRSWKKRG
jgi:hypothetical protein